MSFEDKSVPPFKDMFSDDNLMKTKKIKNDVTTDVTTVSKDGSEILIEKKEPDHKMVTLSLTMKKSQKEKITKLAHQNNYRGPSELIRDLIDRLSDPD